ncbi:MAG TPA: hypothetical protein VIG37_27995 [Methylomirabilota bacterium]|jgi:hypothetical protein
MQLKLTNPRLLAAAIVSVMAIAATGCGGGGSSSSNVAASTPPPRTPAASGTSATPASTTPPSSDQLSGTWSGHYDGAFDGNFTLHWTQSGSKLSGTIKLSNPPDTPDIHGSVSGSSIRFGTVGSEAITYSGSVSGDSMSGSYQTPSGGGSWSASKAS